MGGASNPGRSTRWLRASLASPMAEEWIELRGASMSPSLRGGDRLRVRSIDGPPRPGDIVVAERAGRLVTHRVLSVEGRQVRTRGDACSAVDPAISVDALVGRVVEVVRGGRRFVPSSRPSLVGRLRARLAGALPRVRP